LKVIVDYELNKVFKRVIEHGLDLRLDQNARDFLIDKGYNPEYGARPLRRAIESYIEDPLSEKMLRGEFKDKNYIDISVLDEEHLKFTGGFDAELDKKQKEAQAAKKEKKDQPEAIAT
jgi:ATP-dependent Clp protease ATP-binding subunit ClpC